MAESADARQEKIWAVRLQIRAVLISEWDPIGVNDVPDSTGRSTNRRFSENGSEDAVYLAKRIPSRDYFQIAEINLCDHRLSYTPILRKAFSFLSNSGSK
jgi:hypothetical protein